MQILTPTLQPGTSVLVTGGAGFIGSNLVKALLKHGAQVRVLDNISSGYRHNLEGFKGVQVLEGDVRDRTLLNQAVEGVKVVFHLAASVGNKRSIDFPLEDAEINVIGTLQLLEACRFAGVKKMVVSSSAGIFGELKILPIREDHPIEPDSPYGCTKLCEEKLALSYARLYPMEVVCLRYFNVFGPHQRYDAYGNVIPIFVFNMLNNRPIVIFGDGEQTRAFIHVDDVVNALCLALDKGWGHEWMQIGPSVCTSIKEIAETVVRISGKDIDVFYDTTKPEGDKARSADYSKAKAVLGWEPSVDLETGLKAQYNWIKSQIESGK